jgi:hypothetical protein
MEAFHRFAWATISRDATFVALAATTLMVGFSFAPALALNIGANVALIFAIGLLLRAACLSDDRIVRMEAWRGLDPHERPLGDAGRRSARDDLQHVLLWFAKASAGTAVILYGASLSISLSGDSRSLHAVVSLPRG